MTSKRRFRLLTVTLVCLCWPQAEFAVGTSKDLVSASPFRRASQKATQLRACPDANKALTPPGNRLLARAFQSRCQPHRKRELLRHAIGCNARHSRLHCRTRLVHRTTGDRKAAHRKLDRSRDDLYAGGLRKRVVSESSRRSTVSCVTAFIDGFGISS